MAVFMLNICKFDDCGITFPSLGDLIHHIEDTHIDYDPAVIERKEQQHPQCLPLSYVLKFYSNSPRRESQIVDLKRRIIQHAHKSRNSTNPIERVDEEGSSESDDSNDSWTASEDISPDFILKYGSKMTNSASSIMNPDKPFVCPVPGCKKRYKNLNGIKYHSKNGHKNDGKMKTHRCHSKKSANKTTQALQNHLHNPSTTVVLTCSDSDDLDSSNTIANKIESGPFLPVVNKMNSRQTDPKILKALRLKAIYENHKRLLAANVSLNQRSDCTGITKIDLDLLTPTTSPDSSPKLSNLPINTSSNYTEYL